MPKARSVGARSLAFRPNNCDQLRRSGIKSFSRGWKMYRWSRGTLMHINSRHILGRNRCAGDAPAGYECIEPEVLGAMPLLRSLSQFFGVAAIQITLLRSCCYTTDASNHCGLKQKFTPLRETLGLSGVEGRLWPLKMSKLQGAARMPALPLSPIRRERTTARPGHDHI
jgi:hypothetical protein